MLKVVLKHEFACRLSTVFSPGLLGVRINLRTWRAASWVKDSFQQQLISWLNIVPHYQPKAACLGSEFASFVRWSHDCSMITKKANLQL